MRTAARSVIHTSERRTRRKCLVRGFEAEAEDNSDSCVTCVSCQQAPSGVPKCAICDQVCHAIIPCTSATDDETVPEHMTSASPAREQRHRAADRKRGLFSLTRYR